MATAVTLPHTRMLVLLTLPDLSPPRTTWKLRPTFMKTAVIVSYPPTTSTRRKRMVSFGTFQDCHLLALIKAKLSPERYFGRDHDPKR